MLVISSRRPWGEQRRGEERRGREETEAIEATDL
jgi:hypothetical protein